jgi:hypothetical protein
MSRRTTQRGSQPDSMLSRLRARVVPAVLVAALGVPSAHGLAASAPIAAGAAQVSIQPVPPRAVVMRHDPKLVDIELEVRLLVYGAPITAPNGTTPSLNLFRFPSIEVALPVITRTSWCDTDFTGLDARVAIDARESRLDRGQVYVKQGPGVQALLRFQGSVDMPSGQLQFFARYSIQRWKLDIDRDAAARATWPREWPTWTRAYLGKGSGIDPTDAALREVATNAVDGGPRSTTPYVAAQAVVHAILKRWNATTGAASEFGPDGSLRGLRFSADGRYGIGVGRGTPVELAATCVSALRAIDIPSRVVYGIVDGASAREADRGRDRDRRRNTPVFRSICEFYLPDIGWIPFDPTEMRGHGAATQAANARVKGFAEVSDLELVLPLSFTPVPDGYERADRLAVWGWKIDPRSQLDPDRTISGIRYRENGRGNGTRPFEPAPTQDVAP